MQNAVDYSAFTEKIIAESKTDGKKPTLLLHVCCAPCSSYVLEYLSSYFEITLFYYNPNIFPEKEYNPDKKTPEPLWLGRFCKDCRFYSYSLTGFKPFNTRLLPPLFAFVNWRTILFSAGVQSSFLPRNTII